MVSLYSSFVLHYIKLIKKHNYIHNSLETYADKLQLYKKFIRILEKKHKINQTKMKNIEKYVFNKEQFYNYILYYFLQNEVEFLKNKCYIVSLNQLDNFAIWFNDYLIKYVYTVHSLRREVKILNIQVKCWIEILNKAVKNKQTHPKLIIGLIIDQFKTIIDEKPFKAVNIKHSAERTKLMEKIEKILSKFKSFLQDEYLPHCRESTGLSQIPNGKEIYKTLVKYHTTTDLSPQEIHTIGLSEVKRIRNEIIKVKERMEFKGSFSEFLNHLKSTPRYHYKHGSNVLKNFKKYRNEVNADVFDKHFHESMRVKKYEIGRIPEYAQKYAPFGYYLTFNNKVQINLAEVKSFHKYETETLTLHEGVPGHHLQTVLKKKFKNPKFLDYANFTAFIEGWALYSENLGDFDSEISYFGKLESEMFRAVRLVVDTGLHWFNWDVNKAMDYFFENTSMDKFQVQNEVYRYVGDPGQALAYKMGEMEIKRVRDIYKKEYNNNIKDFHYWILKWGPLPIKFLEVIFKNLIKIDCPHQERNLKTKH